MKEIDKNIKKTEDENIGKKETQTYKVKSNKKAFIVLICITIVILLAFVFSTIFALLNLNNTNIISGIKVNGIEISNLSKEDAIKKLNEVENEKLERDILIKADNFEYEIKLSQIEANYKIEKAVEEAYSKGRNGNIFSNNYQIIKCMVKGEEINLEYEYSEDALSSLIKSMTSKVPDPVIEANYCIENDKLIITKGTKGNSVNEETVKQKIISEILNNNENIEINVEIIEKEPDPIDIEKIYQEVHTEPKDAYYTKNPFQVFPHVDGIDFDLEAAKEIIKEDKEEYEIKLKITTPDVTTSQIGTEAFPDLLSSFSTRYDASNYPRTTNLKLAMAKLNGVVVASGETFSYNKTLGKRTAEAGYREAGGYAGGRVVQTLAGGICQISSTLYDAVIYANLDVVERYNHMFLAGYVGAGKDATVVYGSLDFKFKNTRKYPIMIKTTIGNGVAKVDIYGIKEEVEYDVDIVTSTLSYIPYKTIYEEDKSLKPGQEKVVQNGMNGCKSITYKVLKQNGVEVSREVLSSDTYDAMNKIVKRGPEKKEETKKENDDKKEQETTQTKPNTTKPNTSKPNAGTTKPNNTKPNTGTTKPNTGTTTKPNTGTMDKPANTKPNTGSTDKPSTSNPNEGTGSGGTTGTGNSETINPDTESPDNTGTDVGTENNGEKPNE